MKQLMLKGPLAFCQAAEKIIAGLQGDVVTLPVKEWVQLRPLQLTAPTINLSKHSCLNLPSKHFSLDQTD